MEEEIMETENQEETAEAAAEAAPQRDYAGEVQALYAARPELRGTDLPDEVVQACIGGTSLTEAYNRYAAQKADRSAKIRQQNAQSAAHAPVRSVGHTAGAAQAEDAFLRGFNDEW